MEKMLAWQAIKKFFGPNSDGCACNIKELIGLSPKELAELAEMCAKELGVELVKA